MKTDLEVLKEARELISDRRRWTRGQMALDQWGYSVSPEDATAVRFCSVGAIWHVSGDRVRTQEIVASIGTLGFPLMAINDSYGWEEALRAFDRAIKEQKRMEEKLARRAKQAEKLAETSELVIG